MPIHRSTYSRHASMRNIADTVRNCLNKGEADVVREVARTIGKEPVRNGFELTLEIKPVVKIFQ